MSTFLGEDSLEALAEATRHLESATENLNALLAAEEERIRATGATVNAHVEMSDGAKLVWSRGGSERRVWGFFVEQPERGFQPLTNAPRAVRLEALGKLEPLVAAIHERTVELTKLARSVVGEGA